MGNDEFDAVCEHVLTVLEHSQRLVEILKLNTSTTRLTSDSTSSLSKVFSPSRTRRCTSQKVLSDAGLGSGQADVR